MLNLHKKIKLLYEKTRDKNAKETIRRKQIIEDVIPRIVIIDYELASIANELINMVVKDPKKATDASKQMAHIAKQLKAEKADLLTRHNFPADFLEPIYECKKCKDTGYIKSGRRCNCYNAKLTILAYEQSDLKSKIDTENFETFDLALFSDITDDFAEKSARQNIVDIYKASLGFIENFNTNKSENLLFYGNTGLGKTFLCSCIAKDLIDKQYSVVYQTAYRIIETVQDHKFNDAKNSEKKDLYNMLFNSDLLIIDDLGTELVNSFTQAELFNIINSRSLNQKKTIISTNLNPVELSQTYGERITSRFFGHYTLLQFIGEDLRLK